MKEIRIKVTSIIREVVIWVALLIAAFFTNVYAISTYDGQWSELFSQLHVVFIISAVYYVLLVLLRLIVFGIYKAARLWVLPALQASAENPANIEKQ